MARSLGLRVIESHLIRMSWDENEPNGSCTDELYRVTLVIQVYPI